MCSHIASYDILLVILEVVVVVVVVVVVAVVVFVVVVVVDMLPLQFFFPLLHINKTCSRTTPLFFFYT